MTGDEVETSGGELSALRDGFKDAQKTLAELADQLESAARADSDLQQSSASLAEAAEAVTHLAKTLHDHVLASATASKSMIELTEASRASIEAVDPAQLRAGIDETRRALEQLAPQFAAAAKVQDEVVQLRQEVELLTKMLPDRWRRRAE